MKVLPWSWEDLQGLTDLTDGGADLVRRTLLTCATPAAGADPLRYLFDQLLLGLEEGQIKGAAVVAVWRLAGLVPEPVRRGLMVRGAPLQIWFETWYGNLSSRAQQNIPVLTGVPPELPI